MSEPRPVSEDQYYLQDTRDYVGNCVLWWRKNREGYTTDLREAHIFTKDEAYRQHACRASDLPWPKAYIDARSAPRVDHQVIDRNEVHP